MSVQQLCNVLYAQQQMQQQQQQQQRAPQQQHQQHRAEAQLNMAPSTPANKHQCSNVSAPCAVDISPLSYTASQVEFTTQQTPSAARKLLQAWAACQSPLPEPLASRPHHGLGQPVQQHQAEAEGEDGVALASLIDQLQQLRARVMLTPDAGATNSSAAFETNKQSEPMAAKAAASSHGPLTPTDVDAANDQHRLAAQLPRDWEEPEVFTQQPAPEEQPPLALKLDALDDLLAELRGLQAASQHDSGWGSLQLAAGIPLPPASQDQASLGGSQTGQQGAAEQHVPTTSIARVLASAGYMLQSPLGHSKSAMGAAAPQLRTALLNVTNLGSAVNQVGVVSSYSILSGILLAPHILLFETCQQRKTKRTHLLDAPVLCL
jgi:hypothetical protein